MRNRFKTKVESVKTITLQWYLDTLRIDKKNKRYPWITGVRDTNPPNKELRAEKGTKPRLPQSPGRQGKTQGSIKPNRRWKLKKPGDD